MDIRFSGKNLSITEGIKEHCQEKIVKLERYGRRLVEAHVFLEKQKYFYRAEVTLLAKNLRAYGEDSSKENIFAAIDRAYSHVEKQLKKFRERIKEHRKKYGEPSVAGARMRPRTSAAAAPEGPALPKPLIVRSRSFAPKPMSVEEASLQLQMSREPFLVFRNAASEEINVIFKRGDGDHGLIEPNA